MNYKFKARIARRFSMEGIKGVDKHVLHVRFSDLPSDISDLPNVRTTDEMGYDPINPEEDKKNLRKQYQQLRNSVWQVNPDENGLFIFRNRGTFILANSIDKIGEDEYLVDIPENTETAGILDGLHTYREIQRHKNIRTQKNEPISNEYVCITLFVGDISNKHASIIAQGLNTSVQVSDHSILNKVEAFNWIKEEMGEDYSRKIAFQENADGEIDVRDVITVMNMFDIGNYPTDVSGGISISIDKQPTSSYSSKSTVLNKYSKDFDDSEGAGFKKVRPILKDILKLMDTISYDWPKLAQTFNQSPWQNYIDTKKNNSVYEFMFTGKTSEYKLNKGILYPTLAAFRAMVVEKDGSYIWRTDFDDVMKMWDQLKSALVSDLMDNGSELNDNPQLIGKSRMCWKSILRLVNNEVPQYQVETEDSYVEIDVEEVLPI